MLNVTICDSDSDSSRRAEAEVLSFFKDGAGVSVCSTASAFSACLDGGPAADILIMDVEFDGQDGIELARELLARWPECKVIFVSEYPEFVFDSYAVPHVWYVLKAEFDDMLPQALKRAGEAIDGKTGGAVEIRDREGSRLVPVRDIMYIESRLRKLHIYTRDREYEECRKLEHFTGLLRDHGFVQCHQSYLVNMHQAIAASHISITLKDGTRLPVSRSFYKNVREFLTQNAEKVIAE